MDFTLAVVFGIVALPVLVVAALWIKIVSRGPALYYPIRVGEAGRPIRVWKLRTMRSDAENLLSGHLLQFPEAREEWQRYFKLKKDPRILPGIGHLLRRTSLDELPQLWNIHRGEMSLVGPRPFPEYHLRQFQPNSAAYAPRSPPGLTGLWQVSARAATATSKARSARCLLHPQLVPLARSPHPRPHRSRRDFPQRPPNHHC